MTETNAQDIRFALVDEAGHLTGKPAEGVAEAIAAAVAQLPSPEATWSQTDFDEAMKAHYAALLMTVRSSSKARNALGSDSSAFWESAWDDTPGIFRRIIEKMADMQYRPPWASILVEEIMMSFPAVEEPLMGLMKEWHGTTDPAVSEQIGRDSDAFAGFVIDLFVARQAIKVMGVDKLEVVGDNLRVTKDGRTGSVPITWDAA